MSTKADRDRWVRDASELLDDLRAQWVGCAMGPNPAHAVVSFAALGNAVGKLSSYIAAGCLDDEQFGAVFREVDRLGWHGFMTRHLDTLPFSANPRIDDLCRRAHEATQ